MSIQYDSNREPLSNIIKSATEDATYLIPDLQRPYVWTPRQVILLIDSLFKGWPFGALLIWEVKPDCYEENEGIPHRPFWQVVDKVNPEESTKNPKKEQPATYYMVLDGQQRIQSLLLALGGDEWGFKLYNHDWALDLHERRMRNAVHWSKATLCVDLKEFEEILKNENAKVRKVGIDRILKWAVTDSENGQSKNRRVATYEHPLEIAYANPGRFIRLSRLWGLVQTGLSESDYREVLDKFFDEQLVDKTTKERLLQPLAEFMTIVEKVKNNSIVHALKINSFQMSPQWTKDDYNDAIVNIFTRLNTAGRTLTREEITLAWLKVDWNKSETDDIPAGRCLANLQEKIKDHSLDMTTDEIVRLISYIWAFKERKGNLLDSKDLLKGEIIRPMAKYISSAWKDIQEDIVSAACHIERRVLVENVTSKNALIVFMSWLHLAKEWGRGQDLNVKRKDDFEKKVCLLIDRFFDRWLFGSQWSTVWAVSEVQNFRSFAVKLSQAKDELQKSTDYEITLKVLEDVFDWLVNYIKEDAVSYVEHLAVTDRSRVYLYRQVLWVWHRLDDKRWEMSSIQMRREQEKAGIRLDVDHTIADAFWKKRVDDEIENKMKIVQVPAGNLDAVTVEIAPDGFETKEDAVAFINALGNCTLLEKSFNISKSSNPMWSFLKDVHEFKEGKIQRGDWESALLIPPEMTDPQGVGLSVLVQKIEERDKMVRQDLIDFLNGNKSRQDLDQP